MTKAVVLALLVLGRTMSAAATPPQSESAEVSRSKVQGGAASIGELLSKFLAALAAQDRDALQRLRFTEDEYREVILPGSTEVGKPFKQVTPRTSDLAWELLNTKNVYSEQFLLTSFGGHGFTVVSMKFAKGEQAYAGYHAYKQLRLAVQADDGREIEIRTGSIGEVDGQYKFISYIRD
jgi:hypothetical protein